MIFPSYYFTGYTYFNISNYATYKFNELNELLYSLSKIKLWYILKKYFRCSLSVLNTQKMKKSSLKILPLLSDKFSLIHLFFGYYNTLQKKVSPVNTQQKNQKSHNFSFLFLKAAFSWTLVKFKGENMVVLSA